MWSHSFPIAAGPYTFEILCPKAISTAWLWASYKSCSNARYGDRSTFWSMFASLSYGTSLRNIIRTGRKDKARLVSSSLLIISVALLACSLKSSASSLMDALARSPRTSSKTGSRMTLSSWPSLKETWFFIEVWTIPIIGASQIKAESWGSSSLLTINISQSSVIALR